MLECFPYATTPHALEDLLAQVLGVERSWLFAHPEARVHPARAARFHRLAARLRRGEPLAQLLDEQWFYGHPFRVTRDVLIPRPETELLIEHAIRYATIPTFHDSKRWQRPSPSTILDVGTGSGCIAVTLAAALPHARIIATDISPAALRIARLNARRHGVARHITFLRGALLSPVKTQKSVKKTNDTVLYGRTKLCQRDPFMILANLPYLTTAEWHALPRSIRMYEPRAALDGGSDGLAPYRDLFRQVGQLSNVSARDGCASGANCHMFLEIDPRRKLALARLSRRMLPGWHATFHRDLAGRWRVLHLKRE